MRSRPEAFGAMVAVEEPAALVAVDRVLARRLGVDGGRLWDGPDPGIGVRRLTAPTEVHLAGTDRCPAGCRSCYADAQPKGHEPSADELKRRLEALAAMGVFNVAFGGGESALRRDLPELVAHARSLGLVPTLTTSGIGMTPARARTLAGLAQVNVSYDGPQDLYAAVRGYDGSAVAEAALRNLRAAGVQVGVNTVLTRATYPHLARIAARAEALGAVELQLLRFKPSGRGRAHYLEMRLTGLQIDTFPRVLRALSFQHRMAVRVDCALLPFVVGDGSVAPEQVARFGVMGCEAGRSLMTVRADGGVAPCSFWDGPFTSTLDTHEAPWESDATLEAFRRYADAPPEPCASCRFRPSCRSGCRIVARALSGDPFAPDPECPRVRAHAQGLGKPRTDAT